MNDQFAAGMRRAADLVKLQAAAIRSEEDSYLQWGGPDPRGHHARQMRLNAAKSLDTLALAILAAIPASAEPFWPADGFKAEEGREHQLKPPAPEAQP